MIILLNNFIFKTKQIQEHPSSCKQLNCESRAEYGGISIIKLGNGSSTHIKEITTILA